MATIASAKWTLEKGIMMKTDHYLTKESSQIYDKSEYRRFFYLFNKTCDYIQKELDEIFTIQ